MDLRFIHPPLHHSNTTAPGNVQLELKLCLKWLADLLKDELQRCVMAEATKFCSHLKQHGTIHRTSPVIGTDVAECLVAAVGRLESCLYQLPQPVVNVLCDLANGGEHCSCVVLIPRACSAHCWSDTTKCVNQSNCSVTDLHT